MLKIYCYSRCSTCKKALKWLDEKGIKYELIDIKESHPSEEELRKYHAMSGLPLKRFWNTSGIPYREMGLSTDGMLVKRPLLVGENFALTGFKEEEWTEKLL